MENAGNKNIIEKDGGICIYIPLGRYYTFGCLLLLGALVLIGFYVSLYRSMPKTFTSLWSAESIT